MTVNDLADAAGLHPNTTREHLQRLIDEGFVTGVPETRESKGRPRMMYSAAEGVDHRDGSVRDAKIVAAERRGDQVRRLLPVKVVPHTPLQRQLDALDDHLDQSGFDAELDIDGLRVELHACPYMEMVRAHPEVCGVHHGLLASLLEQTEGPLEAGVLLPFTGHDTCTLELVETSPKLPVDVTLSPVMIIHGVSQL